MLTIKQGWHYILRSPRQSLYLILLVASLFAAILLLLSQYWSSRFTQPVEGFERIINIQLQQSVSEDQYQYYKDRQQSFTGLSKLAYNEFPTTDGRYIRAEVVGLEFFQIFIPTLESGRLFQEEDVELQAPYRIVVSKALLEQQFPGENPTRIDSMQGPMDIVGVVEKGFHFPVNANAWQIAKSAPAEFRQMPSIAQLVGKLAANVSLEQAAEELERLLGTYAEQTGGAEPQANLQTFPESTRQNFGFDIKMLGIILAVVAISGVISIANIVGLDLLKRDREWRIRHLLGIAPEEIIKTPLGSFLILLAAGLLFGYAAYLVLAEIFASHALVNSPAAPFWWTLSLQTNQLVLVVLVFIISLTLVAFLPTFLLLLRRSITTNTVRAGRNQGVNAYWFRWVLLSLQAATAIILMQLMIMLCVLFYHEALADRGFKRNHLLVSTFADPSYQPDKDTLEKQLQAKVADLSTGLALSNSIPGSGNPTFAPFEIPEVKLDTPIVELFQVSPSFFPVMDIQIVAGRGFSEVDVKDGNPVFIVDEAIARKIWPDDSAIGQPIILFPSIPFLRKQGTVVGVASEIRGNPYRLPVAYQPLSQGMADIHQLKVITGANAIKPLTTRLAALSETDEGFAKAETIETVLARNGEMTLDRIFNFLPACLLIMLMLLVSIRNTTLRILEDYRRPLAIYKVSGWTPMAIINRMSTPLYLSLIGALIAAVTISLQLDTRMWFDWMLNETHLGYYVLAGSAVVVLVLAWLSFVIPCCRFLSERVTALLRS